MDFSMGFEMMQEQQMKWVMTPELSQSIQLLHYSTPDLLSYIREEVEKNPVLEITEENQKDFREDRVDWLAHFQNIAGSPRGFSRSFINEEISSLAGSKSLADYCKEQLRDLYLEPLMYRVCCYLIGNLDEKGYVDVNPYQVCKEFGILMEQFDQSVETLHSLDPAGVGASSLAQCIVIQLERKCSSSLAIQIAKKYLPHVGGGKLPTIAALLQVKVKEVQKAVDEIRKCNPFPGASFESTGIPYVYPDIILEKVGNEYEVLLNEKDLPHLFIPPQYRGLYLQKTEIEQTTKEYLQERLKSALWLLKGMEQRRNTLLIVAKTIVSKQQKFFDHGVEYVRPLTLKQVAEEIGLHESTVSRATHQKYMQTPRGLYSLRYFFSSRLSLNTGEELSSKVVKEKIKEMIKHEDKTKPLSDQEMLNRLHTEGICVSRRTVTKYREELGIVSSLVRRRYED